MSAEEEKDVDAPDEASGAPKKPARKKAAAAKKAPAEKAAGKDDGGEAAAAEKPAPKKARAKKAAKAPAAEAKPDEPHEGQNAPEKQRRRKKAAPPAAAAPGAAEEAKEAAKAKPASASAARGAVAKAKGTPRRRVVRARARYVRTSARKARMICGHLRGKSVAEARAILAFTPREVARDWSKLLESAVANAESNHELLQDDLIVREAYADEGPTLKRFRPRAMGRATPIRKRTSHLTITLTPRPEGQTAKRKG
jgi:ribosomal protein L22